MGGRLIWSFAMSVSIASWPQYVLADVSREFPSYSEIRNLVDQHIAQQSHLRTNDIICQSDVLSLFPAIEKAGWKVEDRDELLARMLASNDKLISILRSRAGIKFMREVSNYKLIYDRLDRIVQQPGGERLLADLVKLPDGARYARQKTPPGVPDLEEFLPKVRSGKARHVKDYDKATERIYTFMDFKEALQESYDIAHRNTGS